MIQKIFGDCTCLPSPETDLKVGGAGVGVGCRLPMGVTFRGRHFGEKGVAGVKKGRCNDSEPTGAFNSTSLNSGKLDPDLPKSHKETNSRTWRCIGML